MHEKFRSLVESLEPQLQRLLAVHPVTWETLPRHLPQRAVYLFSEGEDHLYAGRTNNLRNRLRGHCGASSNHHSAAFAFRLAREETGLLNASYRPEKSPRMLADDPLFKPVFAACRVRVGRMDLRFIEEAEPVRQLLLEIYVATALGTRYNNVGSH